MRLPIYQVDAFTDCLFSGNPAAVVPVDEWLPVEMMQAIAMENNLAETAFVKRDGEDWAIRWFTPESEMDLCGHATLAGAYVIARFLGEERPVINLSTQQAGQLRVRRDGDLLTLDFPSRPPQPVVIPPGLVAGLRGPEPLQVLAARDYLVVFDHADQVRTLRPDFQALAGIDRMIIVTAPGDDVDFVSRFFAPNEGIPEDPVTGSAHCTLIPYWAERLGKKVLEARQVSARGGTLHCRLLDDRVHIAGRAVLFLEGTIHI